MSLNDGFIIFSCETEDAPLDHRCFGQILPRYPIVHAVFRPDEDGIPTIYFCHTGHEHQVQDYCTQMLKTLEEMGVGRVFKDWKHSIYF